ncbi:MAG TPA: FAD-dependent oxidoreductase [Kiritimatiellia bacterium]|nr:FAD-dependent oxidoreductase [Kiritimatiellia bacterium]HRZ11500.1 FAD-dependent oxidoreductase [Kiritimatiellia bacterium]HSA16949.1 FAD-dependent oxidoreductase [Kiritimatiellia bacterium]
MTSAHRIEYLVLGAGPTGLGAALRLEEKGLGWRLIEAGPRFGGLASSWVDDRGFTWDLGGHVQFSHYETFDRYMDLALGPDGWHRHERESWVWLKNRFVPYPFQNNLHRLDPADREDCVEGLRKAAAARTLHPEPCRPRNFGEWIDQTFGEGVARLFMRPYNFKVWATPPEKMDFHWIGERVAVPDLKAVTRSIETGQDQVSWGPNRTFRFPKRGGTGAVWEALGRRLPAERVTLGAEIVRIDPDLRQATAADGRTWLYDRLISTAPLNRLVRMAPGIVDDRVADRLVYSATHVVGVGMDGTTPERLKTKCWIYFPESNSPYYRVTVFTNYSPENAPRPGAQWSLMTETSESADKPVRRESLAEDTVRALVEDGLLPDRRRVVSVAHRRLPQAYPTPFLGRDALVDPALRAFEARGIFSRGRFGAWKYEVGNQDHSFAQGYECVERLAADGGAEYEPTLFTPDLVNNRRNP